MQKNILEETISGGINIHTMTIIINCQCSTIISTPLRIQENYNKNHLLYTGIRDKYRLQFYVTQCEVNFNVKFDCNYNTHTFQKNYNHTQVCNIDVRSYRIRESPVTYTRSHCLPILSLSHIFIDIQDTILTPIIYTQDSSLNSRRFSTALKCKLNSLRSIDKQMNTYMLRCSFPSNVDINWWKVGTRIREEYYGRAMVSAASYLL